MFSSQRPFLFPHSSIPHLHQMREEKHWDKLVERVSALPETSEDSLAFQLLMIRICGCLRCTNYKANLGCTTCSQRAVRNNKSSTNVIIHWFTKAQSEIRIFLNHQEGIPMMSMAAWRTIVISIKERLLAAFFFGAYHKDGLGMNLKRNKESRKDASMRKDTKDFRLKLTS